MRDDARARSGRSAFAMPGAIALCLLIYLVAALPASASGGPQAPQAPGGPLAKTLPSAYVIGWGHGTVRCPVYTDRPWVFWQTYATAIVGDRWTMSASSPSLCAGSPKIARKILTAEPSHLGATFDRTSEETVAITLLTYLEGAGKPFKLAFSPPGGFTCYALPTSYGVEYESELEASAHHEDEVAWTRAVGITAPNVICLTGAHRDGKKLTGASYFTFGPLATDCALSYQIKADRPDPEFPGQMMPPTVAEAAIWGDYSQVPCPTGH